jgi:ectoine hydroxylase-related dioxygenase (phytanoyl-CoA dioxygenase family)
MLEPTVILNEIEIEFYHRHGYLSLSAITTPEEIRGLRGLYDRLFSAGKGREEGDWIDLTGTEAEGMASTLPQIMHPARYAGELKETLYWANAAAIARQLLGPSAEFQFDHAINKPPRTGAATPWHQDEAYWDPALEYSALSIWMPLQEATLDNGCMQFVPGSHQLGVQPHHHIGNDPQVHGLEIDQIDATRAVACPLPAGGATIHSSRTLHYTGANLSDQPRRAYILAFSVPPKPLESPRVFPWQ